MIIHGVLCGDIREEETERRASQTETREEEAEGLLARQEPALQGSDQLCQIMPALASRQALLASIRRLTASVERGEYGAPPVGLCRRLRASALGFLITERLKIQTAQLRVVSERVRTHLV